MRKDTVGLYYYFSALCSLAMSFIAATYVSFLIGKGMNLFEVNLVNVAFYATMILCEIPTGALADVFGRKPSFVIACLILAISYFVYAISNTFSGFIVAEAIGAVGKTFSNGAFQSWMVDRLSYQNNKVELKRVFVCKLRIERIAAMIGGLSGALLYNHNVAYPFIAGGISMVAVAFFAIILMREEYFVRKRQKAKGSIKDALNKVKIGVKFAVTDKRAGIILMVGVLFAFAVQAPNMQWQPFFRGGVTSQTALGFVSVAINVFLLLGTFLTGKVLKFANRRVLALVITQLVIGGGILLSGLLSRWVWPSILVFLVHEAGRGTFSPIKDAYLNEIIPPGEERATINSCDHMVHHVGGFAGLLLSGIMALKWGIPLTWIFSGAVLVIGMLAIAKNAKKQ